MEVFFPPQFAPSSTEHGKRLGNAVRTGSLQVLTQQADREAARFQFLPTVNH
jgi:hypothetical protein